jgi:hypothetical protein
MYGEAMWKGNVSGLSVDWLWYVVCEGELTTVTSHSNTQLFTVLFAFRFCQQRYTSILLLTVKSLACSKTGKRAMQNRTDKLLMDKILLSRMMVPRPAISYRVTYS